MKGLLLFDIDGVIRDVSASYRLAIQETVNHFINWHPSISQIDSLKDEGCWNNDWDASRELIKRHIRSHSPTKVLPSRSEVIEIFSDFYFGGDPSGDCTEWKGFIKNEPLLVDKNFFKDLTHKKIQWGFVSGAEPPSAKYILETRLGLKDPPLIAMGDAPDKPDPKGLLLLADQLSKSELGPKNPPIGYVGDTVADVKTVKEARKKIPEQIFISLAVAPPHLHNKEKQSKRRNYEDNLKREGADIILKATTEAIQYAMNW